ncbi:hypothetical protein M2352_001438 [Azospirillum fermentarium]|uniref:hypothetical protein n=1 Tax=Azospirillum fermentarium TaxID=1233114 RepID=UPI002227DDAE|nr:hypothetical protein [Azospirillum fermentarium]MCW2245847.1 hypothetical protein [Azospirillum fermentarium]
MSTSIQSDALISSNRYQRNSLSKPASSSSIFSSASADAAGNGSQAATILTLSSQAQSAMAAFQATQKDTKSQGSEGHKDSTNFSLSTDHDLLNALRDPSNKEILNGIRNGVLSKDVASFDEAVKNGTLNINRAENVPGLNFKNTITKVPGAEGGMGETATMSSSRLPEMDDPNYRGVLGWHRDFGSYYITW